MNRFKLLAAIAGAVLLSVSPLRSQSAFAAIHYLTIYDQVGDQLAQRAGSPVSNGHFFDPDFSNPPTGGTVTGPGGFSETLTPQIEGGPSLRTQDLVGNAFGSGNTYTFSIDGGETYEVLAAGPQFLPAPSHFVNWSQIAQWNGFSPVTIEWAPLAVTGDGYQLFFYISTEDSFAGWFLDSTDTSFTLTEDPFPGEPFAEYTLGISVTRSESGNRGEALTEMNFTVVPEPGVLVMLVFGATLCFAVRRAAANLSGGTGARREGEHLAERRQSART